jgi:hypothetical protein
MQAKALKISLKFISLNSLILNPLEKIALSATFLRKNMEKHDRILAILKYLKIFEKNRRNVSTFSP